MATLPCSEVARAQKKPAGGVESKTEAPSWVRSSTYGRGFITVGGRGRVTSLPAHLNPQASPRKLGHELLVNPGPAHLNPQAPPRTLVTSCCMS